MRAALVAAVAAAAAAAKVVGAEFDPFAVIPLTQLARRVGAADPEQVRQPARA